LLRKLICQSAETTQVGEQHCRLDVVDVSALDGARHDPRGRISTILPPRRKLWKSEDARTGIFDAAALALTLFYTVDQNR